MPTLNPDDKTALERALQELDYPAPRDKVLEVARMNGAPRGAIDAILELPETADFHDRDQLHDALGIDVPGVRPDRRMGVAVVIDHIQEPDEN